MPPSRTGNVTMLLSPGVLLRLVLSGLGLRPGSGHGSGELELAPLL